MLQKYVVYFTLKDCDIYFSSVYSTFNEAKNNIDSFIDNFAKERGKRVIMVTKEELEKLKPVENCLYVRRKKSEAVIYKLNVSTGTFYNSYKLIKMGKVGINEFVFKLNESVTENKIVESHVTNYERGAHVSFVSELKDVLNRREKKPFKIVTREKDNNNAFINSLIEGKKKLKKMN